MRPFDLTRSKDACVAFLLMMQRFKKGEKISKQRVNDAAREVLDMHSDGVEKAFVDASDELRMEGDKEIDEVRGEFASAYSRIVNLARKVADITA